ncbi:HNH endonuclease [Weissella paramesenteroides]|uniref:HNH endonuclease domain protein n=2 Tax=Weissella paramesenteroides TaxID=1249 RepID=C5R843_WEIPA|nr:HNH endonuclease domain protein [Weissella paramesenteroides ATCC 33313]
MQQTAINRRKKAFDKYRHTNSYQPSEKEVQAFYRSREWLSVRRKVINRDHGFDQVELVDFGRLIDGNTVHHIVPLREAWEGRADVDNLEVVSPANHNREHIEKGNKQLNGKRKRIEELKVVTEVVSNDKTEEL